MRNTLTVDGVNLSTTYGVYISGGGTFSAPEKQIEWYQVPNRNGDVLGYSRRLLNIEVSYECFIYANFDENIAGLRSFLLSRSGLVRIEDTYNPEEYRLGVYAGPFEPTITQKLDAGSFTLTFVCQPQRWLKSGETVINLLPTAGVDGAIVTNPTLFTAKPFLRVYGYGRVDFWRYNPAYRQHITIDNYTTLGYQYIDIDCDTMNAYSGNVNLSSYVGVGTGDLLSGVDDMPTFTPGGATHVKIYIPNVSGQTNNITKVEITPRWWEV